ncbi:MAG: PTS sugar transporter subunit IIA [Sporolactobacillus sp.]|jgi:2-O-A-mannosyl-D-glycerate-specific PTS system IIC component|nr:PTS sugar transporter subunit IIA [Sporolactobacillus sp.]
MDLNADDRLLLSTRTVDFDVTAATKKEVLHYIAEKLLSLGRISDTNQFIQDVQNREDRGNTTLTNGFAIPHGLSTAVLYPVIYLVRVRKPIRDWYALDHSNIQNIMMFALPATCQDNKLVSQVKKMMLILSEDENLLAMSKIATKKMLINYLLKKLAMEE